MRSADTPRLLRPPISAAAMLPPPMNASLLILFIALSPCDRLSPCGGLRLDLPGSEKCRADSNQRCSLGNGSLEITALSHRQCIELQAAGVQILERRTQAR